MADQSRDVWTNLAGNTAQDLDELGGMPAGLAKLAMTDRGGSVTAIRKFFTPTVGSRARNIVRAVAPVLTLFGVIDITAEQLAAVMVAVEVVFSGGGVVAQRTEGDE